MRSRSTSYEEVTELFLTSRGISLIVAPSRKNSLIFRRIFLIFLIFFRYGHVSDTSNTDIQTGK